MTRETHFETALGTPLYVDSADKRRLLMAKTQGRGQDQVRRVWNYAAANGLTDLFLDIGANYGEIALGTAYPESAAIELFEPNPRIVGYLTKSMAVHPDRDRMHLHEVCLWNAAGPVSFGVRLDSSGKSSLHVDAASRETDALKIAELAARTLDAIGAERYAGHRTAVLKIDVEGTELECLAGARSFLGGLDDYLAIVELNPRQINRSRGNAETYLDELRRYGAIYELRGETLEPFGYEDFAKAPANRDVVVISGESWNADLPRAVFGDAADTPGA